MGLLVKGNGELAAASMASSSTVIISSQLGQIPPAPKRLQGREQSGHHCSAR